MYASAIGTWTADQFDGRPTGFRGFDRCFGPGRRGRIACSNLSTSSDSSKRGSRRRVLFMMVSSSTLPRLLSTAYSNDMTARIKRSIVNDCLLSGLCNEPVACCSALSGGLSSALRILISSRLINEWPGALLLCRATRPLRLRSVSRLTVVCQSIGHYIRRSCSRTRDASPR